MGCCISKTDQPNDDDEFKTRLRNRRMAIRRARNLKLTIPTQIEAEVLLTKTT